MAEGSVQMAVDNLALTGKSLPEQKAELRQRYKAQLKVVTESAKKEQAAERKANPVKAKAKGKKGKAAEVAEATVAEVAENAIAWGDSFCFWTNEGGVKNTTLCFHAATTYAMAHPKEQVIVVDCDPQANLTATLLTQVVNLWNKACSVNLTTLLIQSVKMSIK